MFLENITNLRILLNQKSKAKHIFQASMGEIRDCAYHNYWLGSSSANGSSLMAPSFWSNQIIESSPVSLVASGKL